MQYGLRKPIKNNCFKIKKKNESLDKFETTEIEENNKTTSNETGREDR